MQAVISPHIPGDKSPHRIGPRTKPSRLVGKSLTFIWTFSNLCGGGWCSVCYRFALGETPCQPLKLSVCVSFRVEGTEEAQVPNGPGGGFDV